MTDNLGPLRRAMSDLAEHGGTTDMYERTLHRSRQVQRRNRIATGAAAAVVVFAVAGAAPFLIGSRQQPLIPAATATPPSSTTPTSAVPSTTEPSSKVPKSTPTSERPQYPDCPSPKSLERIARDLPPDEALPDNWHFPASTVECWRTWATAAPEGPGRGDGVYLFRYRSDTGWRYHSQGSGYQCAELGITSGSPPFCSKD
ncbi:hypothetical protein AB0C12_10855 [Actinoplanes sp. NPDC048967]|uniref:hypothetical protein n=1 Tax=Actinoplanes sp. NPDC048967 TaxID=3155269 RepID=UPI0033D516A8